MWIVWEMFCIIWVWVVGECEKYCVFLLRLYLLVECGKVFLVRFGCRVFVNGVWLENWVIFWEVFDEGSLEWLKCGLVGLVLLVLELIKCWIVVLMFCVEILENNWVLCFCCFKRVIGWMGCLLVKLFCICCILFCSGWVVLVSCVCIVLDVFVVVIWRRCRVVGFYIVFMDVILIVCWCFCLREWMVDIVIRLRGGVMFGCFRMFYI